MTDVFAEKHKADIAASKRKAAQDEIARHKATKQQKVAQAAKPQFNDLPKFKPNFNWGLK